MLVLSRLVNEEIYIGDDVVIKIVRSGFGTGVVRIGITAPIDVKVLRSEFVTREPK